MVQTCKACNQKNQFSCSAKCHKKVNSVTDSNDDIHMINRHLNVRAITGVGVDMSPHCFIKGPNGSASYTASGSKV